MQEVTSAKLLALVIAFLVPAGLALFYALVLTARYIAHPLALLGTGPYDGLSSYMLMAAVGALAFLALVATLEEAASLAFGLRGEIQMFKYRNSKSRPHGFTAGGLRRRVAFVVLGPQTDEDVAKLIELHEEAHAKYRHPAKVWMVGAVLFGETSALSSSYSALGEMPQYVYVFAVASILATMFFLFVLVRALEIGADIYVFKMMGSKSHDYFIKLLKIRYGTWRQPLLSRLTHTQGDFVLLLGDPIAAHAPWEYPLLFALLSSAFFVPPLAASFQPAYYNPAAYYLLLLPSTLIAIYVLSSIIEPALRRAVGIRLTDRGLSNFSKLTAGLYMAAAAASSAARPLGLLATLIAQALGCFIYYLIIKIYLNIIKIEKILIIFLVLIIFLNIILIIS